MKQASKMPEEGGKQVCAAEQGMVFRVSSLNRVYWISIFSVLNRVSFGNETLSKCVKVGDKQSTYVVPTYF